MASKLSLALRDKAAQERIDAATERLNAAGIVFELQPLTKNDQELASLQRLENQVTILEAVAAKLTADREAATAKTKAAKTK